MTIKELQSILQQEINNGNGEKEVCYINMWEGYLCSVDESDVGYYTENCYTNEELICSNTGFIIGNLKEINTNYEE